MWRLAFLYFGKNHSTIEKHQHMADHHYVPQCYLKSFNNIQKNVFTLSKQGKKIISRSCAQICYTPNLYTLTTPFALSEYGVHEDHIEKESFKIQENKYPKFLSELTKFSLNSFKIGESTIKLILETIATIKRRNPSFGNILKQHVLDSYNDVDRIEVFKSMFRSFGAPEDYLQSASFTDYINEFMERFRQDPRGIHDLYLTGFIDTDSIKNVVRTLYSSKIFVLYAPIGREFITSDNPGFTITEDNQIINFGGLGGLFEYYFPITPQCCLFITNSIPDENLYMLKEITPRFIDEYFTKKLMIIQPMFQ